MASDIEYHIFIAGKAEDFLSQKINSLVMPHMLNGAEVFEEVSNVKIVDFQLIVEEQIEDILNNMFEGGYEGLMLREPHVLYDFKRSDALLKIKESTVIDENEQEVFSDCYVYSIEYRDDFPVIENGTIVFKKFLNKVWVLQEDGTECKVGSGYDLKFREYYTKHPEELLNQVVEIRHQKYGNKGRMRFPKFHRIRYDIEWAGPEPYEEV